MRSRAAPSPAVGLLLGALLPHVLFRLPVTVRSGWLSLLVPSAEAILLGSVMGGVAWLWPSGRRPAASLAAATAEFLLLFSLADSLLLLYFNRPLALATDLGYLPDLFGLMRDTAPRVLFVGGLALLPLLLGTLGWGFARAYGLLYRAAAQHGSRGRVVLLVLLGSCLAAVGVELLPRAEVIDSSSLPRVVEEAGRLASSRRYFGERQAQYRALAEEEPPAGIRPFDRLEGRDVFLFILESYGHTLYDEPAHFALAAPYLERVAARLQSAGYAIASNFLSSPAFGGNSWLADSTIAAGVRIPDQAAYSALLRSEVKPMASWFGEAGYRTVNSMPGTTMSWPEGDFFGFQRKFYYKDFGYRGSSLRWAPMTDQFAVAVVHREEVATAARPLFAQFVMISGHYPFALIPRLFEDWTQLGDGSVYRSPAAVRAIPIPAGQATAGAAGYAAAMEYQLDVASDYAVRFLADRRALIVMVGDHQPYSGITGKGKPRSVPIHVLCRDAAVLEPFLRRGYTLGFLPAQPLPHAGLETLLPNLLEDFTTPVRQAAP